jgi:hypothetical protein
MRYVLLINSGDVVTSLASRRPFASSRGHDPCSPTN